MERLASGIPALRAARSREQLHALVEAVDAYARGAGSWDDVLGQLADAKALLDLLDG